MEILFIGGTGTISTAVSQLLVNGEHTLYLLNRGNRSNIISGAVSLVADINDEEKVADLIQDLHFDVVVDFIAFDPVHLERDYRLFKNKTDQFVFISSASCYQKPLSHYIVTEKTPLENPFSDYAQKKIACEKYLMNLYQEEGFPVTIVRPSHTYDDRKLPVSVHGGHSWQVIKRMMEGKPVIIHGDGTSLWTLTHSSDFAKGFVGLLGKSAAIGETFQITSDETLTWNQIYKNIADALNVELCPVHISSYFLAESKMYDFKGGLLGDKAHSVVFDNTKIKFFVPDFEAIKSFATGAKEAVRYILAHKECQIEDEAFDKYCDKIIAEYKCI